ncbi:glutathione S-transferase C-terminal domain-containing protein [Xylophilus ampelinus]|uniref:Glutathione S-transferase-like protein n=1 Tax=Xylophilus ampelinus TaxID=54067 RepID=A0A318SJ73_9BURK|nr:hypothetical protein DFQ15_104111 [Xylophilus ampelinus]
MPILVIGKKNHSSWSMRPWVSMLSMRDQPGVHADVEHHRVLRTGLLGRCAGPMLFGNFSAADAFFAPVCMRLRTYALPVPPAVADHAKRVAALPGMAAWIDGALAEQDFRNFEEPCRLAR